MHLIVKSHLNSFVESHGIQSDDESVQFEKFVNYSIISSRFSCAYDLDDVTTGQSDDSIDGLAIVIDEEVITSTDDVSEIFSQSRRNHDVDILFFQSKRSEEFSLGEFLKFKSSIVRFLSEESYISKDEVLSNAHEIFEAILKEVPKIRNGKPSTIIRFASTGVYRQPMELERALAEFHEELQDLGLFVDIDAKFVDRDEITKLWVNTYSGTTTSLELFSGAALPKIDGIDEAYLTVVRAKEFVQNLLMSEDGNLRTQVFEENVRSFLGMDNEVNRSISATIRAGASASRFPVLNNGITIVSPDVRLQGNTLHLANYQIVNGCQTSNVLFENRDVLNDVMVNVKIVETKNEDVFSELVRATNSQSKVENAQFLSLRPLMKRVEQYFNACNSPEGRLYFERRDRQYVGQNVPTIRTFSLHNATKCVAAMYCNRPDLAGRYPNAMYAELADTIFGDDTKEIVFYASCLTLYRFNLLTSNSTIPQNMKRFKWHILPLVRVLLGGKSNDRLNSRSVEKLSQSIIDVMDHHNNTATDVFSKATGICQAMGEVTADRLKRQSILNEMLGSIEG